MRHEVADGGFARYSVYESARTLPVLGSSNGEARWYRGCSPSWQYLSGRFLFFLESRKDRIPRKRRSSISSTRNTGFRSSLFHRDRFDFFADAYK